MNYRRLGDSGIKLSEIGLGGWLTFGNAVEMEQTRGVFEKAFELGINFFDTANVYAGGKCEEVWGEVLKGRRRDGYVLATKVYFPMGEGPNDKGLSRKHIFEQCHHSLRRLKTEYIDLYQCHRYEVAGIAEATPIEETVRAMEDLIRQGKVLYWGVSEWPVEKIEECLQICGDRYYRPKSSQPNYSAVVRKAEQQLFPLCARAGIGNVVFSPLAQGVLTGKYKPGQGMPAGSRASDDRQNHFIKRLVENQELLKKVQKLEPLAQEEECSMSQLALAWILRRSEVTSCIVGATNPKQLEENAEASGVKLSDETIRRIDEI
ncbi:MAG TPA: aldo/keto reductase family protein [Tepidisphaeraceae bacterium]|jgi:aryl-alcohol dehydrogenase-like predicted oxidoreductase|nr:aldo/keto reductase family protein [Tepidisphaeraceae bacterium]